jgi:hypothetical protein
LLILILIGEKDGWTPADEAMSTWLAMGRDFAWTLPEK